jgi:hypothetical protein
LRHFTPALFLFGVCLLTLAGARAGAAAPAPLPAALAQLASFHGQLTYEARSVDNPDIRVNGSLVVSADGWSLDERSAISEIFASHRASWIRSGAQTLIFDDPLDVDALANSWAVLLALGPHAQFVPDPGGSSWTSDDGVRVFMDADRSEIIGAADTKSAASFIYADWTEVSGLRLPRSIVRLQDGVTVASYTVDGYEVGWAQAQALPPGAQSAQHVEAPMPVSPIQSAVTPPAWRRLGIVFALLVVGLGIVAWTRRDALAEHLATRLASDPRAWRNVGGTVFVSPEGILSFEGRSYRVGTVFYNRVARIQISPLFIRVSAPGVPQAHIFARKFPRITPLAPAARRSTGGFTLVEALTSCALFASVIVGAVFPVLVVLAHADHLAAQREAALRIATNALADEQAALAYGYSIEENSIVSSVDGMTLTETLSASPVAGLFDLTVVVADPSGQTMARIVTRLGPPVPPPGAHAPTPAPSGSAR